MNAECKDRERILERQQPAELQALARHAAHCADCAAELKIWNDISAAARSMQKNWDVPYLWPKIRRALESEIAAVPRRASFADFWRTFGREWRLAGALAVVAILCTAGAWKIVHRAQQPAGNSATLTMESAQKSLLTDRAVNEAEAAETAYLQSIDKLETLARPKIEHPKSPLMASYREKLLLLDATIADCRSSIEQNRSNAYLRRELASVYHEKQQTLEAVLREE